MQTALWISSSVSLEGQPTQQNTRPEQKLNTAAECWHLSGREDLSKGNNRLPSTFTHFPTSRCSFIARLIETASQRTLAPHLVHVLLSTFTSRVSDSAEALIYVELRDSQLSISFARLRYCNCSAPHRKADTECWLSRARLALRRTCSATQRQRRRVTKKQRTEHWITWTYRRLTTGISLLHPLTCDISQKHHLTQSVGIRTHKLYNGTESHTNELSVVRKLRSQIISYEIPFRGLWRLLTALP